MNYYEECRRMFIALELILKRERTMKINVLIYKLSKDFAVSEKSILKRIKLLSQLGKIKKQGDGLKWL